MGSLVVGRPTVVLFGIPIRNVSLSDAVELIRECLRCSDSACSVVFVHAHSVNVAQSDFEYWNILVNATHVFADGVGMRIASILSGTPLCANVNGTDMFPLLCRTFEGTGVKFFLLGSMPGIVECVRDRIARDYPGLHICGVHHGYLRGTADDEDVVAKICSAGADVLLVGMGVPTQEKWLARYLRATGVRVGIAVGGLFDVYSGRVWRPPVWMRRMGLEWLGRLVPGRGEPRRLWRRYLIGNFKFLWHAVCWALTVRRHGVYNSGGRDGRSRWRGLT